ncbi:Alpha/Beta hydrolase protein [Cercophora newfieldiana]|uniref:Alpha/Beta hydrolase protein n=1 Tax=Cercophora newfieldiana TaxID=92897 RepID=A0AA39YAM6_9PEZI|nr:Alpha/Beta hydrolase protein [Cercophora newfieldiana]
MPTATMSTTTTTTTTSPILKAYASTPHGQIHYRFSLPFPSHPSPSALPILLLHMSASSSASFTTLITTFTSLGYPCFAPDMPGFGSSFDPPYPSIPALSIPWYAAVFLSAFQPHPAFAAGCHIVGHHSGAVIGIEIARSTPSFARSLTLEGPAILTASERAEMSTKFLSPFNRPVADGSHLVKMWEYVRALGIPAGDLELLQREALDHARAWRGRTQIYGAVWG